MNPNPRIQKYCDKVLNKIPNRDIYEPEADCCLWRKKIEDLLRKKKKPSPRPEKKKEKAKLDHECCKKKDKVLDKKEKLEACCKKKKKSKNKTEDKKKKGKGKKKGAKMENCRDIINELYSCVKPSIPIRDQLMCGRHVLCILDDLETEEYCQRKKLRKMCDEDPNMPPDCLKLPEKPAAKLGEEELKKYDCDADISCSKKCQMIKGPDLRCIYKKFTRTSKKPKEPRDECDCFRYNFSRCSLDTVVDVDEFKLTEEEIKNINCNIKSRKYERLIKESSSVNFNFGSSMLGSMDTRLDTRSETLPSHAMTQ